MKNIPTPPTKPSLDDCILHLHLKDDSKSGFVLLINGNGEQIGSLFDLRDPISKKNLEEAYRVAYLTPLERVAETFQKKREEEATRYEAAKKISLAEYDRPLGVFFNNIYYDDFDVLQMEIMLFKAELRPKYVWAGKRGEIEKINAEWIWDKLCSFIPHDTPEMVPGSDSMLNKALEEFFVTNSDRLSAIEPDYTLAILLD